MQRSVSYKFDNILVLDYYLSAAVWSPPSGHCGRLEDGGVREKEEGEERNEGCEGGEGGRERWKDHDSESRSKMISFSGKWKMGRQDQTHIQQYYSSILYRSKNMQNHITEMWKALCINSIMGLLKLEWVELG